MILADLARRIGWSRIGVVVGVALVVGLAGQALTRADAEWGRVFVRAAADLLAGRDFLAAGTLYLYPPFPTILGLPFVGLPDWAARLAFYLVEIGCVVVTAVASWRLVGGGRLGEPSAATARAWLVAALGAAVAVPYAVNTLAHQQIDLIISALVAVGALAVTRGRSFLGGALIGVAAAIKGPPLLFLVYFLWRRDGRAIVGLLGAAAVASLLPDAIAPAPHGTWVGLWLERWVLPAMSPQQTLGAWGTEAIYNQSIAGTLRRLAATTLADVDGRLRVVDLAVAHLDNVALKRLGYALMGGLGLATFAAAFRGDRRAGETAPAAGGLDPRAVELAIVPVLMLLLSPMSGLAHFPVVLPAALVLARAAVDGGDRVARGFLAVAIAGALVVNKDLVGARLYDAALWAGAATATALALWAGCVAVLMRRG